MTSHERLPYETVRADPLVVLGRVDFPSIAASLCDRLAADHPGTVFIAVIAAPDTDDEGALFEGIRPNVAELVFTASSDEHAADPAALAEQALDSYGFGQDFVYTAPRLAAAIDLALSALAPDSDLGWSGTALLVLGHHDTISEARAHLESRGLID